MAFRHGEALDAPALAVEGFDGPVVVRHAPVGAHDAVIAVFLAEQVRDDVLAEVVAHVVSGRVDAVGNRVVGHHGGGFLRAAVQLEGAVDKSPQVRLEGAARIDGVLAVVEVRVAAGFLRTAGGPVLDHRIDTLRAPAVLRARGGLEAVHIGAGHVGVQVRILAERAVEAAPAGFGGEVDLRAQRRGDAQRAVFLRGDLAELLHDGRVEGGGEAEGGGPEGDLAAGAQVELGRRRGLVARVGGVVGRDAVAERLHEGLHVVVPAGCGLGALHGGHEDRPQVVFLQELLLRVGDFRPADGLMAAVEHQAGDFLDGKLRGEVLRAGVGGEPPVLVRVQRAVAVQVLESEAVHGEEGSAGIAQRGPALLGDELEAVGFGFLPFGAAGREQQGARGRHCDAEFHSYSKLTWIV